MGELAIRRNRGFAAVRPQEAVKTEKTGHAARSQGAARTAGPGVSEDLRQLLNRVNQAEARTRESRRTLQTGEAVLAEVQDRLSRAAELLRKASGEGGGAALQAELERLCEEIDRMAGGASAGDMPLFLDGDINGGAPLDAVINELLSKQEGALPGWLAQALTRDAPSPEELLAALGLDETAGAAELLAAIASRSPDGDSAAGYLAALYLGSVISGGTASGSAEQALDGLQQLLEKIAEGMTPDQAVDELTNGVFSSLSDLQSQFTGGTATGLQDFLTGLLLSGGEVPAAMAGPSLLTLLAGTGGVELDLLMGLLTALENGQSSEHAAALTSSSPEAAGAANGTGAASSPVSVLEFGNTQAIGRDLSGVLFNEETGELTIGGTADVVLRGTGEQEARPVVLTGSGTVTLRDARISTLTAASSEARISIQGEALLDTVRLEPGISLTLGGGGVLRTRGFQADASNTLRLTGGAAVLEAEDGGEAPAGALPLPVVLDGPASLAARAASVSGSNGKPLDAFDVIWRTMLPGWSALTSLEIDGRQTKLTLDSFSPLRLWLQKGEHGFPAHTVVFRGRDKAGRQKLRYAYLRWSQRTEAFEEIEMYPNPFTVTGGEADRDWTYEQDSHTLRILTNQVTAVSGGSGLDANREPFSGRIALDSGIGAIELALGGVACRVDSGRAFSLGRENDVTLLLRSGTDNHFESGEGCAGISLEDGTSLRVDRAEPQGSGKPTGSVTHAGSLTAAGGSGGAGIGRDSGGSPAGGGGRNRSGHILILGGDVTAIGSGGGAGIGGGLGAPAGDISIHGGKVRARAAFHAAAIGAGVQGPCGDILITGTARVVEARGGDPGSDIGACLFGSCGKVVISGAADIGDARLRTRAGISLQMGEDIVTLPQFRLSSRVLGLDRIDVSTRKAIQAAKQIVEADRRWVSQLQDAYSAMYGWMEQSAAGLDNVRRYINVTGGLVRDDASAGVLLEDTRRSIPLPSAQAMRTHGRRGTEDVRHLLR